MFFTIMAVQRAYFFPVCTCMRKKTIENNLKRAFFIIKNIKLPVDNPETRTMPNCSNLRLDYLPLSANVFHCTLKMDAINHFFVSAFTAFIKIQDSCDKAIEN